MSEAQAFEKYPMMMVHPNYRAPPAKVEPGAKGANGDPISGATRLAPVTAANETERAYWEAQGYESAGEGDPGAWAAQRAASAQAGGDEPYVHQEYPKWVAGKLVNSEDEERLATESASIVQAGPQAPVGEQAFAAGSETLLAELAALKAENERLSAMKDKRTAKRA